LRRIIYNQNNRTNNFRIPSLIAGGLYLIIIIGAIMGVIKGIDILKYYNNVGCKKARIFDDFINGKMP
jgi:hypothetical protein